MAHTHAMRLHCHGHATAAAVHAGTADATRARSQIAEAMTEPPADAPRPKELYIDEQWDRFIDLTVRRTVYGTLAGGVAALLLARALRESVNNVQSCRLVSRFEDFETINECSPHVMCCDRVRNAMHAQVGRQPARH